MDRLKELRIKKGIKSQRECAKILGILPSTYNYWENGKVQIDYENLKKLADFYNVSTDYLLGRDDKPAEAPEPTAPGSKWVPVYGNIAGGTPITMITDIEDWEEIDADTAARGEIFALRVRGDSMAPRILDGDVVIIRQQEDIETGEIAAVVVNGDSATLKKIRKDTRGIYLVPLNPEYETMFYTNKEVDDLPIRILGKMIELRGKF